MQSTEITPETVVRRYAGDLAYVAGAPSPAIDIGTLIDHLGTAAHNFSAAGINGHEELEHAALHLSEIRDASSDTARGVFLSRADELLRDLSDMTDEYRTMAGD